VAFELYNASDDAMSPNTDEFKDESEDEFEEELLPIYDEDVPDDAIYPFVRIQWLQPCPFDSDVPCEAFLCVNKDKSIEMALADMSDNTHIRRVANEMLAMLPH